MLVEYLWCSLTDSRMEDNMEDKKIFGKYETDSNFTTVYCDNTIYTIARNTGDWGCVAVGQRTAMGRF